MKHHNCGHWLYRADDYMIKHPIITFTLIMLFILGVPAMILIIKLN